MPEPVRCDRCGASSEGDLEATLVALVECEPCVFSVAARGTAGGAGWRVLRSLVRRFGEPAVRESWRLYLEAGGRGPGSAA